MPINIYIYIVLADIYINPILYLYPYLFVFVCIYFYNILSTVVVFTWYL
jgi:hypothetical protein